MQASMVLAVALATGLLGPFRVVAVAAPACLGGRFLVDLPRPSPRSPPRTWPPSHQRSSRRRFLPIARRLGYAAQFNAGFPQPRSATESITPRPPASLGSGKPPTSSVNLRPLWGLFPGPECPMRDAG